MLPGWKVEIGEDFGAGWGIRPAIDFIFRGTQLREREEMTWELDAISYFLGGLGGAIGMLVAHWILDF